MCLWKYNFFNVYILHRFVMYTSLLEVEHEGGSDNESCIEIENDDLLSELLHHVVGVRLHQQIAAVHLRRLGVACCGVFFHQRFGDLQREWGLTVLLHPDPRSERLCGATRRPILYSTHLPERRNHMWCYSQPEIHGNMYTLLNCQQQDNPNIAYGAWRLFFPIGKCTIMPTSACPITSELVWEPVLS